MKTTSNTIRLEDGRLMGYAEFGDSSGLPCMFIHGYASSRWMAGWTIPNQLLELHGIRIIAVDRPGYGLSSPHRQPEFTQWANDATALIEFLDLPRVAVLGVSMGAGHALALTAQRPDVVTSTTILSGMAPVDSAARWTPASRGDALYWQLARRAPLLLRRLCSLSASMVAKSTKGDADAFISRMERALPEPDRQVFRTLLDNDRSRTAFLADMAESSRQGGAATANDLVQYLRPWGFEPADINSPVRLWHGHDDPKVPAELAQRLADRLPNCTPQFVPGGHFSPFPYWDNILRDIAKESLL